MRKFFLFSILTLMMQAGANGYVLVERPQRTALFQPRAFELECCSFNKHNGHFNDLIAIDRERPDLTAKFQNDTLQNVLVGVLSVGAMIAADQGPFGHHYNHYHEDSWFSATPSYSGHSDFLVFLDRQTPSTTNSH